MRRVVWLSVMAVALVGCSNPEAEQAPEPGVPREYSTVVDLRDAMIEAGYDCPHWKQTNAVKFSAESGSCSGRDSLSVYATKRDLARQVDTWREFSAQWAISERILVGPNWIINAPKPAEWAEIMGGTVTTAG